MVRRLASLAAALAGLGLVASGCADEVADQAAEKSIEKQIEDGAGGDADVDIDDDKVKIETSDGTMELGNGELPDDFPADVPVVEGEVLMGISVPDGFQVTITFDGSVQEAFDDATARLTDAGFQAEDDLAGPGTGLFTGKGWNVMINASDVSGDTTVSYLVSKG